jgi:CheY-like chemotaxis protein
VLSLQGIGLFLCKSLVELMGGVIYLDTSYDSGVEGCPGSRFVIDLQQSPISFGEEKLGQNPIDGDTITTAISSHASPFTGEDDSSLQELPEQLSVLFVDDDPILRKLFARTVRTVVPNWKIREASNGETALNLIEDNKFDLIFVDMYMASVEKQLLGTETVVLMRHKGLKCRICGLSANDKEREFLESGADAFTFKPFPCEARALTVELCRILFQDGHSESEKDLQCA